MKKAKLPTNYCEPIPHSMLSLCKAPPSAANQCAFFVHDSIYHSQCEFHACGYCTSARARRAAEGRS